MECWQTPDSSNDIMLLTRLPCPYIGALHCFHQVKPLLTWVCAANLMLLYLSAGGKGTTIDEVTDWGYQGPD